MPIPLAIIWHQHQPYYKDLSTGELLLPWVRLHGIKDYYGMAKLIDEFPGVRCSINLVPSMLDQLLDYTERGATDPFLRSTEIPADALSAKDAHFVLDHFFMAQWDRMIRIYPRFSELLEMRRIGRRPAALALDTFSIQDLRDLQVWFNLTWFHPVSFEESEVLRELRKKGKNFSENDKAVMLAEQKRVLARVIPLHKELLARKQVDLTTTPFYHPILPLLHDMQSAREAMPGVPLASGHLPLSDDAEAQIRKAVEFHKQLFGVAPEGMWPSEGSVSTGIVPAIARHGIQWIATDEEILGQTLKTPLRGNRGKVERPNLLYRAWQCDVQGAKLGMLFRDHHLSDLIGFQYQSWDGAAAADDFLMHVQATAKDAPAAAETLVTVVLDGENCWEHYPDQGIDFLRSLYRKLERGTVTPVRASDFIRQNPPTHKLERIFAGSWINHDFYIWAGHAEDRRAWEYVYQTRRDLVDAENLRDKLAIPAEAMAKAWEELFIAEGSDWYWWYGDDHTSGNDAAFDSLFRTHLKNVYRFIGRNIPSFLDVPIKGLSQARRYSDPRSSLSVTIDGKVTSYFEWLGAGKYHADKEGGVMNAALSPLIQQIHYGVDEKSLCVRIDPRSAAASDANLPKVEVKPPAKASEPKKPIPPPAHGIDKIALRFEHPRDLHVILDVEKREHPELQGPWGNSQDVQIAWDEIVEFKIPFAAIGLKAKEHLSFYIEALSANRPPERFPRSFSIEMMVPNENAHEHEWIV
jgi:alpha-amylase/alpha-mannosidase (GH57 family)